MSPLLIPDIWHIILGFLYHDRHCLVQLMLTNSQFLLLVLPVLYHSPFGSSRSTKKPLSPWRQTRLEHLLLVTSGYHERGLSLQQGFKTNNNSLQPPPPPALDFGPIRTSPYGTPLGTSLSIHHPDLATDLYRSPSCFINYFQYTSGLEWVRDGYNQDWDLSLFIFSYKIETLTLELGHFRELLPWVDRIPKLKTIQIVCFKNQKLCRLPKESDIQAAMMFVLSHKRKSGRDKKGQWKSRLQEIRFVDWDSRFCWSGNQQERGEGGYQQDRDQHDHKGEECIREIEQVGGCHFFYADQRLEHLEQETQQDHPLSKNNLLSKVGIPQKSKTIMERVMNTFGIAFVKLQSCLEDGLKTLTLTGEPFSVLDSSNHHHPQLQGLAPGSLTTTVWKGIRIYPTSEWKDLESFNTTHLTTLNLCHQVLELSTRSAIFDLTTVVKENEDDEKIVQDLSVYGPQSYLEQFLRRCRAVETVKLINVSPEVLLVISQTAKRLTSIKVNNKKSRPFMATTTTTTTTTTATSSTSFSKSESILTMTWSTVMQKVLEKHHQHLVDLEYHREDNHLQGVDTDSIRSGNTETDNCLHSPSGIQYPRLKSLKVTNVSLDFSTLGVCFPKLQSLLAYKVTDQIRTFSWPSTSILPNPRMVWCLPGNLIKLNLHCSTAAVDVDLLEVLEQQCKVLQHLELSGYTDIEEGGHCVRRYRFENLKVVKLFGCFWIRKFQGRFLSWAPNLETLHLENLKSRCGGGGKKISTVRLDLNTFESPEKIGGTYPRLSSLHLNNLGIDNFSRFKDFFEKDDRRLKDQDNDQQDGFENNYGSRHYDQGNGENSSNGMFPNLQHLSLFHLSTKLSSHRDWPKLFLSTMKNSNGLKILLFQPQRQRSQVSFPQLLESGVQQTQQDQRRQQQRYEQQILWNQLGETGRGSDEGYQDGDSRDDFGYETDNSEQEDQQEQPQRPHYHHPSQPRPHHQQQSHHSAPIIATTIHLPPWAFEKIQSVEKAEKDPVLVIVDSKDYYRLRVSNSTDEIKHDEYDGTKGGEDDRDDDSGGHGPNSDDDFFENNINLPKNLRAISDKVVLGHPRSVSTRSARVPSEAGLTTTPFSSKELPKLPPNGVNPVLNLWKVVGAKKRAFKYLEVVASKVGSRVG